MKGTSHNIKEAECGTLKGENKGRSRIDVRGRGEKMERRQNRGLEMEKQSERGMSDTRKWDG